MTSLDAKTLDLIARCLDKLTRISGLSAAECLRAMEEYSQPLSASERTVVLFYYQFRNRSRGTVH